MQIVNATYNTVNALKLTSIGMSLNWAFALDSVIYSDIAPVISLRIIIIIFLKIIIIIIVSQMVSFIRKFYIMSLLV